MKKLYLIANWKMNPTTPKQAEKLAGEIVLRLKKVKPSRKLETVLCPPFLYLPNVIAKTFGGAIKQGGQNCHFEDSGAYTGEISPKMLKNAGCKYVIIGHSERRMYFEEKGELINKKITAALKNKLVPILAVGEKKGESLSVVKGQLKGALKNISEKDIKKIVIAYEPVWAIGTGNPATPDEALSAKILIQKTLGELYSAKLAGLVPVIYGGSTDSKNILSFIEEGGMDGALVGGSSLKASEFVKMASAMNK